MGTYLQPSYTHTFHRPMGTYLQPSHTHVPSTRHTQASGPSSAWPQQLDYLCTGGSKSYAVGRFLHQMKKITPPPPRERTPFSPPNQARGAADGLGAEASPGAVGAPGVERDANHGHVEVGNLCMFVWKDRSAGNQTNARTVAFLSGVLSLFCDRRRPERVSRVVVSKRRTAYLVDERPTSWMLGRRAYVENPQ